MSKASAVYNNTFKYAVMYVYEQTTNIIACRAGAEILFLAFTLFQL